MQCDHTQPSCVCAQSPSSIRANSHYRLEGHVSSSSSEGTITPPYDSSHPAGLGYASSPLLSTNEAESPIAVNTTNLLPIPSNHSSPTSSSTSTPLYNKPNTTTATKMSHLVIPIHDPTDDMDSDTPIYKSEETAIPDQTAVLGELTHKSSEELMNQIYSGFIDHKDRQSCKMTDQVNEFEDQQ
ncbi:hypothetical protein K501DRAFT_63634 [Backusella circina FSU 941]|nr:hypothetical protein K501DRAFT_63634 [Backusella circina FSU 941]